MRHWLPFAACLFLAPAWAEDGGIESLRQTGKAFSSVAKKVAPSVVFIQVEERVETERPASDAWPFQDDLFRRFFGDRGGPQRVVVVGDADVRGGVAVRPGPHDTELRGQVGGGPREDGRDGVGGVGDGGEPVAEVGHPAGAVDRHGAAQHADRVALIRPRHPISLAKSA